MFVLTDICQPIRKGYFDDKALETRYSQHIGGLGYSEKLRATEQCIFMELFLPSKTFERQPVHTAQCPCPAHAEVGSDFNYASVVWNGFIHPLHVSQTAVLYWEAEDFWVCIRVERPWRDPHEQTNVKYEISVLLNEWAPQQKLPQGRMYLYSTAGNTKCFTKDTKTSRQEKKRKATHKNSTQRQEKNYSASAAQCGTVNWITCGGKQTNSWALVLKSPDLEVHKNWCSALTLQRRWADLSQTESRTGLSAGLHIQKFILALYFSVHY